MRLLRIVSKHFGDGFSTYGASHDSHSGSSVDVVGICSLAVAMIVVAVGVIVSGSVMGDCRVHLE